MKSYKELNSSQKDHAVDKALKMLVKKLISESFDYLFHSPISQKHFYEAIILGNTWREWDQRTPFDIAMESDEILEELTPAAEAICQDAHYPQVGEVCFSGICK